MPPFRLDLTAWALRRRLMNAVDHWEGDTYWRILVIRSQPVRVAVRQREARLEVTMTGDELRASTRAEVSSVLERLLGFQTDLRPFYEFAAGDQRLNRLAQRFIGLKPPRFPTLFEALVNGISCQQLSLAVGITVMNRLVARYLHSMQRRMPFLGLGISPGLISQDCVRWDTAIRRGEPSSNCRKPLPMAGSIWTRSNR